MKLLRAAFSVSSIAVLLVGFAWLRPTEAHNPTTTTVLFHREVAQILNAKCAACHKANGMSMPLQTYDEVRPWAVAIKEEILARRMPPWPAERGYGAFANDAALTLREQEFLISWIEGGVPRGESAPPAYVDHGGHWMLGTPTHSFTATAVAASPLSGFRRYVIETQLTSAVFVRAFDFIPGDAQARAAFYTLDGTGQFLGGWTPMHTSTEFPEPAGVRLPAKARVFIDVLSTSTEPSSKAPELAMYAADGAARPITDVVLTPDTGTAKGAWHAHRRLPRETTLLAIRVDMSHSGGALEVRARRPDGSIEPLLLIREFASQWQTPYVLRRPLMLPAGSVIEAVARFDPGERRARFGVHLQAFEPAPVAKPQLRLRPAQPAADPHHLH